MIILSNVERVGRVAESRKVHFRQSQYEATLRSIGIQNYKSMVICKWNHG